MEFIAVVFIVMILMLMFIMVSGILGFLLIYVFLSLIASGIVNMIEYIIR
nr:MAG TPA: hypothetical protein [Bacteriophage sp.]